MQQHIELCFVLLGTYLISFLFLYECRKLDGYKFPVYSTEFCPRYQTEWEQRSSAINCNESNGYLCLSNENITELLEFCYLFPFIWMQEGVCLSLSKRDSKLRYRNCSNFISGCPSVNYMSSKSFQYLTCTFIGNGCFLAEPNCSSTLPSFIQSTTEKIQRDNVTTYDRNETDTNYSIESTEQIHAENDRTNSTNKLYFSYPLLLGILVPICALGVLFLFFYFRKHIPSQNTCDPEIYIGEEEVPFIQGEIQDDVRNSSGMQLPDIISSHISESPRNQAIFEQWQHENVFFISTRASEVVEKEASEQNLVIVTGHSGSGKSAIIQHIALKYRSNGWNVKPIDEIDEFLGEFSTGKIITSKTLFVLNDPMGIVSVDEIKFSKWRTHEATLKACLKKVKLIVSCRKYILNDGRVKSLLTASKLKSKLVDISQDQLKLNYDEKQRIWNIYSSNKISFAEASIAPFDKEAYFPLLCQLYFSTDRNKNDGFRFFKEPREVLEKEIENFRLYSKETFYALVLLVFFDGVLDVEDILEPDTETSKKKYELALELSELERKPAPRTIADTLDNLKGFLVKKLGDTYHFNHDFVMEVTTYVFGKCYPKALIKYADIGFLRKNVRLQSSENQNNPLTLYLCNRDKTDLGKRLFCAVFGKDLLDVVLNPCLKDEKVIEGFIHELSQNPLKLEKLLEKKNLQLENENLKKLPEAKKLISSKFDFMKSENETSPLNALIVFGHTQLSLHCLIALKQISKSFKDQLLFSSVCCNGSLDMFFVFSDDEIFQCLREKWGTLYPIEIASTFHNYEILNEVIGYHKLLDIKVENRDGWTLLMMAAAYDSCEFDENFEEKTNETKRNETVQMILRNGADINQCDKEGTSPLYAACQEGHDSTVKLLLKNGASINLCDKDKTSPLFVACQEGYYSTVQLLLKNGAQINLCDKDKTSPLFVACQEGQNSIVQLLLQNGAQINLCDKDETSPLSVACHEGHELTVKLLLNNGAEINLSDKENGSPLYVACQEGHERIVQLLLSKGANINKCDEEGMSPLFIACQEGHQSTVQLLLKNGADINLCDEDGTSPLYIACQEGHENVAHLLLNKGADINSCDKNRVTPLFIACRKGYDDIIKLLIAKNADINLSEINGISPLYVAFAWRHCQTVKILLECGADTSVLHGCGSNSLSADCNNKDDQTIFFLLQSNNIIDNIYDLDSFFTLFVFCQVENMLRISE